jgi:hypothetical protein
MLLRSQLLTPEAPLWISSPVHVGIQFCVQVIAVRLLAVLLFSSSTYASPGDGAQLPI